MQRTIKAYVCAGESGYVAECAGLGVISQGRTLDETSQRGSHVKLSCQSGNSHQILVIPHHHELDRGTLKAIIRQADRFVPEAELHPHFYAE